LQLLSGKTLILGSKKPAAAPTGPQAVFYWGTVISDLAVKRKFRSRIRMYFPDAFRGPKQALPNWLSLEAQTVGEP
jgi:hypothetical protein